MSAIKVSIKIILCISLLFACGRKKLPVLAYLQACADTTQQLLVCKEMGAVRFKLQYLPVDQVILQRYPVQQLHAKGLDSLRRAYDTLQFYTFTIENAKGHSEPISVQPGAEIYSNSIDYFSYHAQADFQLLQQGDTLPCLVYHFERSYDLAPKNTISMVFKNPGKGDRILRYNDRVFGLGTLYLGIAQKDIDRFPIVSIASK